MLWPIALFLVWRDAQRRRGGRWSPTRRFWSIGLTLSWALCVYAFFIEPTFLVVRHVTIESDRWSGAPLRIGVISDTHVGGPHMSAARMGKVVARMNAERPELVVLLGDYVDGHRSVLDRSVKENVEIANGVRAFAGLVAPHGIVAVWGNHDWWYGGGPIARVFRETRIPLLENQSLQIERADGPIYVAGLAELLSPDTQPSFDDALAQAPRDSRTIVIAHRPDMFASVPDRVALMLVGHTHCGQINPPILGPPMLPGEGSERWPCGAYVEEGHHLFVTGGVGESAIPARFNAPPEIVLVTLRAPQ